MLRICTDDLLVVEEHSGITIILPANVRDVAAEEEGAYDTNS